METNLKSLCTLNNLHRNNTGKQLSENVRWMIPTGYNWALNGKTNAILKKRRWISPRRIWNNNADKESKAIPTGMETHK